MFDRIIVSADDSSFILYWPLVSKAWAKYFPDKKISLAFVTNKSEDDKYVQKYQEYGEVILFKPVVGIPTGNQAKMARHILAGRYPNEICMIEDIDTIPLQTNFVNRITGQYQKDHLLIVGSEVYDGSPHEGKFPISNITAQGSLFKEIINPNNLPFEELIQSWIGINKYDHKEAINVPSDVFSDESLLRVLITNWNHPDQIIKARRDVDVHKDWIDRSWWFVDQFKLKRDGYVICNFLRPFDQHYYNIEPVVKHICGDNITKEEILLQNI